MNQAQALDLLADLRERFPMQTIPLSSIEAYAEDLLDLDPGLASQAIRQVCREQDFWPSVARIRTTYAEIKLAAPPFSEAFEMASTMEAEQMPSLVYRARRRVGDRHYWRIADRRDLRFAFKDAYEEVVSEAIREIVVGGEDLSPTMKALPVSDKIAEIKPGGIRPGGTV